jgi:hypothetical protein
MIRPAVYYKTQDGILAARGSRRESALITDPWSPFLPSYHYPYSQVIADFTVNRQ